MNFAACDLIFKKKCKNSLAFFCDDRADTVTAAFTNTKGGTVDTGVLLDSAPYVVLLLLAAGGAVLFLRRRIHRS